MATVTLAGVEELQAQVRGDVITPDDGRYEDARKVYNAMIDKHPALVVSCRDVADVQAALAYGRANGLDIAVRGAGHNGAGLGTVDGGIVIDLSPMRWARVDPSARTAQVGGGSMMADIDHATHPFGLAVPVGIIGTTGVGLLLGGGVGHLTRKTASRSTTSPPRTSCSPTARSRAQVRTRTRTCSGRSGEAAATSALSPR
jgi:FAD/FMN-containing dehydrogenases